MERKKKPGPDPDNLKIDNPDWEDAMKRALKKERPKEGWPDKEQQEGQEDSEN